MKLVGELNELALFAGNGGGIWGSLLVGHRIVCAVEIDPYDRESLMRRQEEGYFPPFPIWDNVRTFDGRPCRGSVDVVTAGFPCQPFSLAGQRRGFDDERNLWPETYRIIGEINPRYVMLENVPGIRPYLPVVIRDLRRIGYTVKKPRIIAAAAVGAGHIRKRVWIFAYDKSQCERAGLRSIEQAAQRRRRLNDRIAQALLADDDGLRQWHQPGWWEKADGETPATSENTIATELSANNDGQRQQQSHRVIGEIRGRDRDDTQGKKNPYWDAEPGLARLVCRAPYRRERIRATGNIQVPAVARLAWEILT